jgi:hypothetical protein
MVLGDWLCLILYSLTLLANDAQRSIHRPRRSWLSDIADQDFRLGFAPRLIKAKPGLVQLGLGSLELTQLFHHHL